MNKDIITVSNLNKTYNTGFKALIDINLTIRQGEIFALLGPNGAGKTTLINAICGIVNPTSGRIKVSGYDVIKQYIKTRSLIGLVPQEVSTDMFEKVWETVRFSRSLFGKPSNPLLIEKILKDLFLWDKKNNKIMTLSGGMKRRLMIAKALSHEPKILFLDEPTAGVDVELRREMWNMVRKLKDAGTTIILTTHYIEEAQKMADRIGIIQHGKIILIEETFKLIKNLGRKKIIFSLNQTINRDNKLLHDESFEYSEKDLELIYTYNPKIDDQKISSVIENILAQGIIFKDLQIKESSLEEIFVELVRETNELL